MTTRNSAFLQEKSEIYETHEIQNCKKMVLSPYIGYRKTNNPQHQFATEKTTLWSDRTFFDSIIFRKK